MSRAEDFSKNYFDGHQKTTGAYSSFDEERLWPAFEDMVSKFKNMMPPKRIPDIGCAKGFLVSASLLENYLYNKQMRSGYCMLGYQKKYSG